MSNAMTEEERKKADEKQERIQKEFTELCKPLNEWLKKNCHPHTKIMIDTGGAEIVEGIMGVSFEVKG